MSRIAFACSRSAGAARDDDLAVADRLAESGHEAGSFSWEDPGVDWNAWDIVLNRAGVDHPDQLDAYLGWVDSIEADRLRNPAAMIKWNCDRRYLADLDAAGLPVPPTLLLGPGDRFPELQGEFVVKPVFGSGAEAARFGDDSIETAESMVAGYADQGQTVMVQPFIEEIESHGESATIAFNGRIPNPVDTGPAELELVARTLAWLGARFGSLPLFARVDTVATRRGAAVLTGIRLTGSRLVPDGDYAGRTEGAQSFASAILEDVGRL